MLPSSLHLILNTWGRRPKRLAISYIVNKQAYKYVFLRPCSTQNLVDLCGVF